MFLQLDHTKTLLILAMVFIQTVRSNIYCDPKNHEYYERKIDRCSKCPQCPEGKEPINIEDFNPKVKYLKGPVECRSCTDCKFGTYSNVPAYECKPCTNCSSIGKTEIAECTRNSDAICEKRSTAHNKSMVDEEDDMSVRNNTGNNLVIIIISSTFGGIALIVTVAAACYCVIKEMKQRHEHSITLEHPTCKNKRNSDKKEYIAMHQKDIDNPEVSNENTDEDETKSSY